MNQGTLAAPQGGNSINAALDPPDPSMTPVAAAAAAAAAGPVTGANTGPASAQINMQNIAGQLAQAAGPNRPNLLRSMWDALAEFLKRIASWFGKVLHIADSASMTDEELQGKASSQVTVSKDDKKKQTVTDEAAAAILAKQGQEAVGQMASQVQQLSSSETSPSDVAPNEPDRVDSHEKDFSFDRKEDAEKWATLSLCNWADKCDAEIRDVHQRRERMEEIVAQVCASEGSSPESVRQLFEMNGAPATMFAGPAAEYIEHRDAILRSKAQLRLNLTLMNAILESPAGQLLDDNLRAEYKRLISRHETYLDQADHPAQAKAPDQGAPVDQGDQSNPLDDVNSSQGNPSVGDSSSERAQEVAFAHAPHYDVGTEGAQTGTSSTRESAGAASDVHAAQGLAQVVAQDGQQQVDAGDEQDALQEDSESSGNERHHRLRVVSG